MNDATTQMHLVWAVLLLYVVGGIFFFPKAFTVYDEVFYVREAVALSHGHATINVTDPLTGGQREMVPSYYSPGISLLMTPLVWLGGWQASFLLGFATLVLAVFCTARWITESRGSPIFALIVLGYIPTLFMARTAMSDVPSAAFTALGLWLFWEERPGFPWRRLLAGFLAGASLCIRDVNPLLFIFFFAGALLRRERTVWALVVGGLTGVGCRLAASYFIYGNPFLVIPHQPFTGASAPQSLLIYGTALLVMVPGGLISAVGYRGRRWPELICTTAAFMLVFLLYDYNGSESGGLKQWILGPRFLIPLLPVLAFAMSHTVPQWFHTLVGRLGAQNRRTYERTGRLLVACWLIGVTTVGFFVSWRSAAVSRVYQQISVTLYGHTSAEQPVVTATATTVKFLNEVYGSRMVAELTETDDRAIGLLLERYGALQIVFFDRDDSEYWAEKAHENQMLIGRLARRFSAKLALQQRFSGQGVLQIWQITHGA